MIETSKRIIRHSVAAVQYRQVSEALRKKKIRSFTPKHPRLILCLQMNAIGDAIMTQPAWEALRRSFPEAAIDLACSPHVAPLFENDPAIGRIHRWQKRRHRSWLFTDPGGVKGVLAEHRYDLIIDFTALPLTAALCSRGDAPPSVGFQRQIRTDAGTLDLGRAYDATYPYSEHEHLRDLMLGLASLTCGKNEQAAAPKVYLDGDSLQMGREVLQGLGLQEGSFLLIHPGAKWPPKTWPVRHWRALLKRVREGMNLPVLLLGAVEDRLSIEEILKGSGESGTFSHLSRDIRLSAALIRLSALCLCHDSAAMHMAAALGVKTIALFGPVLPSRSAPPTGPNVRVLRRELFCSPCQLYYSAERCRRGINFCMHEIKPEEVAREVADILASL